MSTQDFLCGDTIKIRWVNSGVLPSSLSATVYNGSEALVDSGAMTSSGNGLFYYLHTVPSSPGYYVTETSATILGKTYKNRTPYRAVLMDVN